MGKEELHFATCFSAKQTTENEKEVLRLAFCDVLRRNKHALNKKINQQKLMGLLPALRLGNKKLHFATYFSTKQTTENGKEILRLAFCGVLRRNKHTN